MVKKSSPVTFLSKLYDMLEGSEDLISWTPDGLSFDIKSPSRLAIEVIPKYFRHNNFSSFQRQLNYFGFQKVRRGKNSWMYAHDKFRRGDKESLLLITRRTNGPRKRKPSSEEEADDEDEDEEVNAMEEDEVEEDSEVDDDPVADSNFSGHSPILPAGFQMAPGVHDMQDFNLGVSAVPIQPQPTMGHSQYYAFLQPNRMPRQQQPFHVQSMGYVANQPIKPMSDPSPLSYRGATGGGYGLMGPTWASATAYGEPQDVSVSPVMKPESRMYQEKMSTFAAEDNRPLCPPPAPLDFGRGFCAMPTQPSNPVYYSMAQQQQMQQSYSSYPRMYVGQGPASGVFGDSSSSPTNSSTTGSSVGTGSWSGVPALSIMESQREASVSPAVDEQVDMDSLWVDALDEVALSLPQPTPVESLDSLVNAFPLPDEPIIGFDDMMMDL